MSIAGAGLIFGFLIATAYGSGFHLIVGGRARTIPVYLFAAWLGFAIGHFIGIYLGVETLKLGIVQLFTGSIGAWSALIGSQWLINFSRQTEQL